jgi:hypothetical protein
MVNTGGEMRITRFAAVLSLALAAAPTLMAATRFTPDTNVSSSNSMATATKLPANMELRASLHSPVTFHRTAFTFTVTVNGSYDMQTNQMGYFFAVPSGGTAPYTYTWYLDGNWIGTGSGSSWSGYLSAGTHYTYTYVTDAGGQGAWSNTLYINVH